MTTKKRKQMERRIATDLILQPDVGLLVKLASIAVHVGELFETPSPIESKSVGDQIEGLAASASFDVAAIRQLIGDSEVKEWLTEMDGLALIPKKR